MMNALWTTYEHLRSLWKEIRQFAHDVRGVPFIVIFVGVGEFALVSTEQGADLSVTNVDDPRKIFALCVATFYLGLLAWFWTRTIIDDDRRTKGIVAPNPTGFPLWIPRALGVSPFLFAVIAILRSHATSTMSTPWNSVTAVGGVGAGFLIVLILRRGLIERAQQSAARKGRASAVDPNRLSLYRLVFQIFGIVAAALGVIIFTIWQIGPARFVGAISVFYLGLACIIAVLAAALHGSRVSRLPIFGALIVSGVIFSIWVDNHEVGRRAFTADPDFGGPTQKHDLKTEFDTWLATAPPPAKADDGIPIFFVSAEGGASRAGYWTAEMLGRMQEMDPSLSKRLFAISSVSGGTVGALAFLSQIQDDGLASKNFRQSIKTVTADDFLSPAVASLLFPDLVQRFLPVAFLPDRGEALERAYEHGWSSHCQAAEHSERTLCRHSDLWRKPFLSLWNRAEWTPILLINGTRQEDGARIITSNILINPGDFPNTADFHVITGRDIRISTAILNGARFPLISPSGTLRGSQGETNGHELDGGYYDGGGSESLRDIALAVLKIAESEHVKLHPIFIEISNNTDTDGNQVALVRSCYGPMGSCHMATSGTSGFPFNDAAPLEGLYKSRNSHGVTASISLAHEVNTQDNPCDGAQGVCSHLPGISSSALPGGNTEGMLRDQSQTIERWGHRPVYVLLRLCKVGGKGLPLDWALSAQARDRSCLASGDAPDHDRCGNMARLKAIFSAYAVEPANGTICAVAGDGSSIPARKGAARS